MFQHNGSDEERRNERTLAVMIVDTKGFSKHDDDTQGQLQMFIVDVLGRAFRRGGLERVWENSVFEKGTGDGYLVGFEETALLFVVNRFFDALQEELRLAAQKNEADMRMRLALNVGPVSTPANLDNDAPVGKTIIDTFRLVDGDQVKQLLERSHEDITRLAVVVTDPVLERTLRIHRNGWHGESEYVPCDITVQGKPFEAKAHLHVPAPSEGLLVDGLAGVRSADPEPAIAEEPPKTHRDMYSNNGDVAHRDINRDSTVNNAGRDINQPLGDVNNGRQSGRRVHPWIDEARRSR